MESKSGEQWSRSLCDYPRVTRCTHPFSPIITISIFPREMSLSFLPKNSFLLPAPITPNLVALGLDENTASTVSKVYLSAAHTLKGACETEYIRACKALIITTDERGYSNKQLRSKLLTATIARYTQALSKWAEEAAHKAEASIRERKPLLQSKVGLPFQFASRTSTNLPKQAKNTTLCEPSHKAGFELSSKQESMTGTVSTASFRRQNLCLTIPLGNLPARYHRSTTRISSCIPSTNST